MENRLGVLLYLLYMCFVSQAQTNSFKGSLVSTEFLSEDLVAFRIYAPFANKVNLKSPDMWDKIDFVKSEQGVWEGFWKNARPGAYRYHFEVDGMDVYDPGSASTVDNTSLLTISSGNDFFTMKKEVPHGGIAERYYFSETLQETRRMQVWTPAGFEKSHDALPVLYLIHGGGDTDRAWPTIGCAGNILDNLLYEGKIKPMIVVMPNGTIESDNALDRVPLFMDDLISEIIPFVEANYRVYANAENRAIMGLSMGGLETLETITFHHREFAYIGILSSGWWISDSWAKKRGTVDNKVARLKQLKKIAGDFNESVQMLYFTQGGPEDLAYDNGMETQKLFDEAGIKYQYSESPGGHTWMVWRKNLWDLAPLLFK